MGNLGSGRYLALFLGGLVVVCAACGSGGGGGSSRQAEALQPVQVSCPDSLAACDRLNAGSDIYVGFKINGPPGTCPTLLAQGQPAFDAFGTAQADQPWDSGLVGTVSLFTSGGGQSVNTLTVAPDTAILCCALIDTQGAFGPDGGDPYVESDCWPFHPILEQNDMVIEAALP